MNVLSTLRRMTGMNLARSTVERAIERRMDLLGQSARKAYVDELDEAELRELVEYVVVPESWLFRDPQAFALAADFTRQRLAGGARLVRILSVPCAGGEEPYSMAMALCDAGIPAASFSIDAIDISAACIARAEEGVYGRNAFRGQELSFRDRYFDRLDADEYRIVDAVRSRIRFSQGNILEGSLGGARHYDIVFCRNLLIYFDEQTTRHAIGRLGDCLLDDGILLAGYAEVPSYVRNGFSHLPHRQAFALRKDIRLPAVPAMVALGSTAPAAAPARSRPVRPSPSAGAAAPRVPAPAPPGTVPAAPLAPSLLAQARAQADAGQSAAAESTCRAWLAQQPDAAEAYFILGLLAQSRNDAPQAQEHFKRCLYLQPDHYETLCHLALLQEQNGNRSAAATLKARAARVFQRQQAH